MENLQLAKSPDLVDINPSYNLAPDPGLIDPNMPDTEDMDALEKQMEAMYRTPALRQQAENMFLNPPGFKLNDEEKQQMKAKWEEWTKKWDQSSAASTPLLDASAPQSVPSAQFSATRAPQQQQQQQPVQNVPFPPAGRPAVRSAAQSPYDAMASAMMKTAEAENAVAQRTRLFYQGEAQDLINKQLEQQQMAHDEAMKKTQSAIDEYDRQRQALADRKIDVKEAMRVAYGENVLSQSLIALSLIYGAKAAALRGGENTALKMVENSIDRELKRQAANIEAGRVNMDAQTRHLDMLRQRQGDLKAALDEKRAQAMAMMSTILESKLGGLKDDLNRAKVGEAITALNIKASEYKDRMANEIFDRNLKKATLAAQVMQSGYEQSAKREEAQRKQSADEELLSIEGYKRLSGIRAAPDKVAALRELNAQKESLVNLYANLSSELEKSPIKSRINIVRSKMTEIIKQAEILSKKYADTGANISPQEEEMIKPVSEKFGDLYRDVTKETLSERTRLLREIVNKRLRIVGGYVPAEPEPVIGKRHIEPLKK